nr:hypothetical protein [Kofleriaceae bacterium]
MAACASKNGANGAHAPQCSDGIDNDGDGLIDFPDDPGCVSAEDDSEDSLPSPACSDGRDNDGDGKIDYPNDPGCYSPDTDDETDDCPDGPNCPQCSNGKDDDGNGLVDYPNDPGCSSAGDGTEYTENAAACAGISIMPLPADGMDAQMFATTSTSTLITSCGGGAGAPAFAYELHLAQAKVIVASTDGGATDADTVIDLRSSACGAGSGEIACNDDVSSGDQASTITASLQPGVYYIIVEGHDASVTGGYALTVQQYAGVGTACSDVSQCGPGLTCRVPLGGSAMQCENPMCSDGVDDDGDGKADYPDDPGCTDPSDNDETDDCPNGSNCPQCANGKDDDGDGATDYPNDSSCKSASWPSESCVTTEGIAVLKKASTNGNNSNASDDFLPSCADGSGGLDLAYQLDLPATDSLAIGVTSTDFLSLDLALLDATCNAPELACDSDTFDGGIVESNFPAGRYYLMVDGDDDFETGAFTVTVSGTISEGASCESVLATAGALKCALGTTCKGTAGSRTCQVAQCSDGLDNNNDGKIDYPFDPGCATPSDDSETTVCPGSNCPVCSNGSDDDADGKTDFPKDTGCSSAAGKSEVFCSKEKDVGAAIKGTTTTGTLTGAKNNLTLDCDTFDATGPDKTLSLALTAPLATLHLDTDASTGVEDTILELWDAQCSAPGLACNDDDLTFGLSTVDTTDVPAGNYAVTVQTLDTSDTGAFTVTFSGTLAKGTACTDPLVAAGALTCAAGSTCTAGVCQ